MPSSFLRKNHLQVYEAQHGSFQVLAVQKRMLTANWIIDIGAIPVLLSVPLKMTCCSHCQVTYCWKRSPLATPMTIFCQANNAVDPHFGSTFFLNLLQLIWPDGAFLGGHVSLQDWLVRYQGSALESQWRPDTWQDGICKSCRPFWRSVFGYAFLEIFWAVVGEGIAWRL